MSSQAPNATRRFPRQTCSASRSKITVEEPLADLESTETWQKIHGHAIVAGERLQEKINESVTCRFCQGSVQLVENLGSKSGLGSLWMFQCQNESCPSRECNFRRRKKAGLSRLIGHRFLAFELSVAVTRQPQRFLVFLVYHR